MGLFDSIGSVLGGGLLGGVTGILPGAILGGKVQEELTPRQLQLLGLRPEYALPETLRDPNTGLLQSQYQLSPGADIGFESLMPELQGQLGNIQLDKRGLEAIRERALGQGMSPWARLQLQQQAQEEAGARDLATRQSAGAQAQARADLASRGGLGAGARERLARQGQQDLLRQRAELARGGIGQRLGIGQMDEQQRTQLLSSLPGMEVQALQPEFQKTGAWQQLASTEQGRRLETDQLNRAAQAQAQQFNIQQALQEKAKQDAASLAKYQEEMRGYGAEKTAQAAQEGGK